MAKRAMAATVGAMVVLGQVLLGGAPAGAAEASGGLLASGYDTTQRLDPVTGQALGVVGAGQDATVSRSGRLAYVRDVDPCHPDVEGCFGANDLLVTARDGTRERVLVHNTNAQGGVSWPDWSPDGRWITYYWGTPGERGLNIVNVDGTGNDQLVQVGGPGTFSPDGRSIAYVKDGDVAVIDLETRESRAVTTDGLAQFSPPDWSPDGRTIVYAGQSEFLTVPAAGGPSTHAGIWPNALSGVFAPVFAPNGRKVAFTATEASSDPDLPGTRRVFTARVDGARLRAVADLDAELTDWLRGHG
ncbi:TolB family protein [Micromonospora humi]|uniref:TolB protein n=1 Tax=Micromonospora humi TaxID=745366 RepID=A0A1C5K4J8_9ACTN|nr:PD40 domain-containing protein [Micromonospora humi]SCG77700.1 TolB protein [Micromonospora humi]